MVNRFDLKGWKLAPVTVRNDLRKASFIANEEKSISEPTQTIEWLGFTAEWNSSSGTLGIAKRRIVKIKDSICSDIEISKFCLSARQRASLTGQLMSTGAVVGNIAGIMTMHCNKSVVSASSWDSLFHLDEYTKNKSSFWQQTRTN